MIKNINKRHYATNSSFLSANSTPRGDVEAVRVTPNGTEEKNEMPQREEIVLCQKTSKNSVGFSNFWDNSPPICGKKKCWVLSFKKPTKTNNAKNNKGRKKEVKYS